MLKRLAGTVIQSTFKVQSNNITSCVPESMLLAKALVYKPQYFQLMSQFAYKILHILTIMLVLASRFVSVWTGTEGELMCSFSG